MCRELVACTTEEEITAGRTMQIRTISNALVCRPLCLDSNVCLNGDLYLSLAQNFRMANLFPDRYYYKTVLECDTLA